MVSLNCVFFSCFEVLTHLSINGSIGPHGVYVIDRRGRVKVILIADQHLRQFPLTLLSSVLDDALFHDCMRQIAPPAKLSKQAAEDKEKA